MACQLNGPCRHPRGGGGERIVSDASFAPQREHFIRGRISANDFVP